MKIVAKRKIKYPMGLERTYAKELVAYVDKLMLVIESFLPKMEDVVLHNSVSFDAADDDYEDDEISQLMAEIGEAVAEMESMRPQIETMYGLVSAHAYKELTSVFNSVFGTMPSNLSSASQNPFRMAGNALEAARGNNLNDRIRQGEQLEQLKRIWVQENLDLIKSIDAESLRKIRETMTDMII